MEYVFKNGQNILNGLAKLLLKVHYEYLHCSHLYLYIFMWVCV